MTGEEPEYSFGGRLSLDLTWTLRYRAIAPTELLVAPDDLRRWLSEAVAEVDGPLDAELLDGAIALREAIHDAARAIIDDRDVRPADRRTINDWAARPGPYVTLERGRAGATGARTVLRPRAEAESALAAVAVDAVELLGAGDGRLRLCEGPGCSLLFHDGSRPGRRRWCSTERCGNRVNTATYRRRRAGAEPNP
jgi:predicted RNA-binding Zn ribbon-like protein